MSGEDGCTMNERVLGTRACTYHGRNNDEDDAQLVREAWTVPPIAAYVNGGGGARGGCMLPVGGLQTAREP